MRISICFLGLAILMVGCKSVTAFTKIENDGSFVRTVNYSSVSTGSPSLEGIESGFGLPTTHPGVSYHISGDRKTQTLTTSRRVSTGHRVPPDISVLGMDGKPHIQSQVSIQKLPNGDVSYDETIHWIGDKPNLSSDESKQIEEIWSEVLPDRLQSKLSDPSISVELQRAVAQTLFGPPYPYIFDVATSPDLLDLTLEDQIQDRMAKPLQEIFPDLTPIEQTAIVDRLLKIDPSSLYKFHVQAGGGQMAALGLVSDEDNLTFVVKPPGAVVETNGLQTRDGHVYWSLLKESLPYRDEVLHLVAHSGDTK